MSIFKRRTAVAITTTAVIASAILWLYNARLSPIFTPTGVNEQKTATLSNNQQSPQDKDEQRLAEAYWKRYEDVRNHTYWGESGAMGIKGPRHHYEHYGKLEGRTWGLAADQSKQD